ncbi:Oxidation resistance protein 1 [Eumeta japonica]|uniref:Oxidation resistance protein 1 n=1 Tax=Eumeta variegata TaxID=151549 RepID=A0A4C1W4X9_EUMVA|nr:Oxidation resistance protein 1 [Eumeta japonica]
MEWSGNVEPAYYIIRRQFRAAELYCTVQRTNDAVCIPNPPPSPSHEDEHAKRIPPPPPVKTVTYTVRDRDTLTSVAARFDTTPSELTKLNRLATQFIFPGQTLFVPDKRRGDLSPCPYD